MRHQVVMHHGNHTLALAAGFTGLLGYPLQRFGLDASAIVIGVGLVSTAGEGVVLIHVAVNADDDDTIDGLAAVTERGGIPLDALTVAIVAVDARKLVAGDSGGWCCVVSVKTLGIGVVAIVVAGYDQRADAVLRHPLQIVRHALMAGAFAVIGEVTGDEHHLWIDADDAVGDGGHDVVAHLHHLAVARIGLVNGTARSHQVGTEQVGVTDDHDAAHGGARRGSQSRHCRQ